MEKRFAQTDERLFQYAEEVFRPIDPILAEIRQRSEKENLPGIQVGKMDGLHLEILARAFGAKKIVEIGTLGGYSGVNLARALPDNGKLYTFEFNPDYAEVARESFKRAGLSHKVELHVGAAIDQLPSIEDQGPFDLVFIDADKVSYPAYLKWAEQNLRTGGAVLADNTFAWGLITDDIIEDESAAASVLAIREFNQAISQNGKFRATILPTHEGLTLGVKVG